MSIEGREQITKEQIEEGIKDLVEALEYRLNQKGYGTFASKHEILGVLQEEMAELVDAVRSHGRFENTKEELLDIAVGALFGYICIKNNKTDW